MTKTKEIPISTAKIEEGIGISLKKSAEHLDGAEALISKNLLNDAAALIEFAIEEFGRAVYLRERLQLGVETIEWSLEHGSKAHDLKYEQAFTELPKNLQTIWQQLVPVGIATLGMSRRIGSATIGHISHSRIVTGKKEMISPSTRCDAVFIKFDEKTQKWHNGIKANSRKLKLIVDKLRENIDTFKV